MEQHRKEEQGSKWTRRHRYKQCVRQCAVSASQASAWETNTTAQWMLDKGVNKVRGAGLTHDRDYGPQDEDLLVRTIGHALDLDFDEMRRRNLPQLEEATEAAPQQGSAEAFGASALEWECFYCPLNFATYEQRASHIPSCLKAVKAHTCGYGAPGQCPFQRPNRRPRSRPLQATTRCCVKNFLHTCVTKGREELII